MTPSDKPTARTYGAAGNKSTSFDLVSSGDRCFLCGRTIGETDPIGFYQGKSAMVRCHRGCINIMEVQGGTPKDFHRFMESKNQPPIHDKPVHADVVSEKSVVEIPEKEWTGPRSIKFDDFDHMQSFISQRGPIPSSVRVTVGDYVMQAGG